MVIGDKMSKEQIELNDGQKMSKLLTKMHLVKKEMGSVIKSSINPFFKSKYADLNAHLQLLEPLLDKHNLVLTQSTVASQMGNVVQTEVCDIETGARLSSSIKLPEFNDMQKLGGAITYGRRYTVSGLFGMQAEDDDGNTAVGKKSGGKKKVVKGDF